MQYYIMIFLKTAWNMKTFNNFTDIKFIYLSNRPALSCTDLKKTMKSSLILWMMQQKKWRRNLSNGEVIHAEVWLCQFGYYCDVLVVSCLCGCLCVKSESMWDTRLSKKGHLECWRRMPRSIVMQPVFVQHLWTTLYG